MKNNDKSFWIRLRNKTLFGFFSLVLLAFLFVNYGTYSKGVRSGVVIKLSKKGVLIKTMEGQLNLQTFGATKSGNMMSETFNFSVPRGDDETIKKLEEVILSGERVSLHFKERYLKLFWKGETRYFVDSVERLKPAVPQRNTDQRDIYHR